MTMYLAKKHLTSPDNEMLRTFESIGSTNSGGTNSGNAGASTPKGPGFRNRVMAKSDSGGSLKSGKTSPKKGKNGGGSGRGIFKLGMKKF
jgi:hypothetical protein